MKQAQTYLMAAMKWYTPQVLSWGPSSTMDEDLYKEKINVPFTQFKKTPETLNPDQNRKLMVKLDQRSEKKRIKKVSQDGKERRIDNVFI